MNNYAEINKRLWDKKTEFHYNSEFYDVPSFVNGRSSLNDIELALLGNIKGKKVLHLQCHFGQDSISLARLGAEVTAVDLSSEAIRKAQDLNRLCKTSVRFVESDILKLKEVLNDQFDIVYTSYGVLGWLPDMNEWSSVVHHFLKPQGKLVLVEFHPVVWMFSYDFSKVEFNYFNDGPIVEELEGTYADVSANIQEESITWNHSLSEVVGALLSSGMKLVDMQEFDYSPYNCFQNTLCNEEGKYRIKNFDNKLPMLYSLVVEKG